MRMALFTLLGVLAWIGTAQAMSPLARHLDQALAIDPVFRALSAEREAVAARGVALRSPFAGPGAVSGSFRSDTRGPQTARETDLEIAAPLWLPGQQSALSGSVSAAVEALERRIGLRRLEVAGRLREAWWDVLTAEAELRAAEQRRATATDIARQIERRGVLGDIAGTEAMLGRNEELAAALAQARAEAAVRDARAAYALLTGGATPPRGTEEPLAGSIQEHPAIVAATAALAAAEAQLRVVAATPRDNPEAGIFGRQQAGPLTEDGFSFGLRVRIPLASEGRNAPRRAEAEAGRRRAAAELEATRRIVLSEAGRSRQRLAEAQAASRLAREQAAVTDQQMAIARRSLEAGEIGLFDLYRVRQLQIEATAASVRAAAEAGRARSRLNQAQGMVPR